MTRSRRLPASQPSSLLFPAALTASVLTHALILIDLHAPGWWGKPLQTDQRPIIINLQPVSTPQAPANTPYLAEQDSDGGGNTAEANQHATILPMLETVEATTAPDSSLEPLTTDNLSKTHIQKAESNSHPTESNSAQLQLQADQSTPQLGEPTEQQRNAETGSKAIYGRSAKGLVWARYALNWQRKMERIGTSHFPEQARLRQLYGGPELTVLVNADGSLASVRIVRSSGSALLDDAAQNAVQLAAPFAPFPPELAKQYGTWEITRKWVYTDDNRLSSQ